MNRANESKATAARRAVASGLLSLCLLGWVPSAPAFGLGALQVNSALGEPFDAQITLFAVSPTERRSLRVGLGDQQTYAERNIKRPAIINAINVSVQEGDAAAGGVKLQLTSTQPVSTALLELLVVAEADDGRAVRKYTALLYPDVSDDSTPSTAAPAAPDTGDAPRGKTVTVAPKQTLWSISKRNKYPGVSTEQMLVAIYRANPTAFNGGINHMKVGSTLVMPSPDAVKKIDAAWAKNWVESRT